MRIKERLLNYVLAHLYKAITTEDLNKSWDSLSEAKKKQYFEEAKQLQHNQFYHWLSQEIEKLCMERMYLKATNEQDMIFGKAGIYVEDIRRKKLDKVLRILSTSNNSK